MFTLPKLDLTKYKSILYAVALSALSSIATLGIAHQVSLPHVVASINVVGPSTANPGDWLEFTANTQNLSILDKSPVFQWKVVEATTGETQYKQDGGTGIFFVASQTAQTYYVVASATSYKKFPFFGWLEPLGSDIQVVTVNQPTPNPGPDPGPTPDPTPDPTIPDGQFAIANVAYGSFPNVPKRVLLAQAIATNYTGIASAISAGGITTLKEIFEKIKEANGATLNKFSIKLATIAPWQASVQARIYDLYTAKKLVKTGDYAVLFNEIASGLSYIK
jgi:hypothetical protein